MMATSHGACNYSEEQSTRSREGARVSVPTKTLISTSHRDSLHDLVRLRRARRPAGSTRSQSRRATSSCSPKDSPPKPPGASAVGLPRSFQLPFRLTGSGSRVAKCSLLKWTAAESGCDLQQDGHEVSVSAQHLEQAQ
jgi:hypothetical protein